MDNGRSMESLVDFLARFSVGFDVAAGYVERIIFRALGLIGFVVIAYQLATRALGSARRGR